MHTRAVHPAPTPDCTRSVILLCVALMIALVILASVGPWFALPFLLAGAAAACFRARAFTPPSPHAPAEENP